MKRYKLHLNQYERQTIQHRFGVRAPIYNTLYSYADIGAKFVCKSNDGQ